MKRILIFFLLLFAGFALPAQNSGSGNFEFLLRGKALGFVIIEDNWVRTFSIGAEVRYKERFSFAADIVHFRWRYEKEVHDLPDPEQYSEYSQYDARNYIALETRYYIPLDAFAEDKKLYANLFSKSGKRHLYSAENYPLSFDEPYKLHSTFQDLGTAVGFQLGEAVGFDFNLGAAYRWETMNQTVHRYNTPDTYEEGVKNNRWLFNIRVNFFWNLSY